MARMLIFAGEKRPAEHWLGSGVILGLLILSITILAPSALHTTSITGLSVVDTYLQEPRPVTSEAVAWSAGVVMFIIVQFMIYLVVYFKVEDRTKRAEKALPDALYLVASNIRAGMTPFQAMKLSARKEFGPLSEEIDYATARAFGTESFSDALLSMKDRIRSTVLDRAMQLFISSMKAGGHLAQLLEEMAKDISETRTLKNELVTNTKMYTLLIMFTIIVCAPLLQAISIHFVEAITDMQDKASVGGAEFGMSFLAGEVLMTPKFLVFVSIAMLVVISILASMLTGVIVEGKEKYGLRYAPLVMSGALAVFFVSRYLIAGFFGTAG
jgi:flagellar protein FlaJ